MMDEIESYCLTTDDNPFSPFTQEKEWRAFDMGHGYCTEALIARIADDCDPNTMSDYQMRVSTANAIESILELNPTGNYKLVTASDYS